MELRHSSAFGQRCRLRIADGALSVVGVAKGKGDHSAPPWVRVSAGCAESPPGSLKREFLKGWNNNSGAQPLLNLVLFVGESTIQVPLVAASCMSLSTAFVRTLTISIVVYM